MADATVSVDVRAEDHASDVLGAVANGADEAGRHALRAAEEMRTLGEEVNHLDGQDVDIDVDVDDNASGELSRIDRAVASITEGFAEIGPAGAAAFAAVVAGAATLAGYVVILGSIGATSMGVLKLGTQGVGDAINLLAQEAESAGDVIDEALGQQVREALDALTPSAQRFAAQIVAIKEGPLAELQRTSQEGLFSGITRGIEAVGPVLQQIQPQVQEFATMLGQDLGELIQHVALMAPAFLDFANAGMRGFQQMMPGITSMIDGLGRMFEEMARSGQAQEAMAQLAQGFIELLPVLPQLIMATVEFAAAISPTLATSLQTLAWGLQGVAMFLEGVGAIVQGVIGFFVALGDAIAYVVGSIGSVGSGVMDFLTGSSSTGLGGGSIVQAHAASGGVFTARPGGLVVNVAEGGQDEAVIPLPRNWQTSGLGGSGGGDTYVYNISGVVGPASQVTAAIRRAQKSTSSRGFGYGV